MLDYIKAACMRHDTVVAIAFRRALGLPTRAAGYMSKHTHAYHRIYDGMDECMAQRFGVRL